MKFIRLVFFFYFFFAYGMPAARIVPFRMAGECFCRFNSFDQDPTNMTAYYSYNTFVNYYGRLLYYNEKEKVVPMLSKTYQWTNSQLEFEFDDLPRTSKGLTISPQDAEKSIYRSMYFIDANSYQNIKKYLCPKFNVKSINEKCDGLITKNNKLILRPVNPRYKDLILELLIYPAYSIFPKTAIADRKDGYKIIDPHHSTGAYHLYQESDQGEWIFHQNLYFPFSENSSPLIIKYINTDFDYPEAFIKGFIDIIPEYNKTIDDKDVAQIKLMEANIIKGLYNSTITLFFNIKLFQRMNVHQRAALGNLFRIEFLKKFNYFGQKINNSLFSNLSKGRLSSQQLQVIDDVYLQNKPASPSFDIIYNVPEFYKEERIQWVKDFPHIKVNPIQNHLVHTKYYFETSDIFTKVIYTSLQDSFLDLIEIAESGLFQLPKLNMKNILDQYTQADSKQQRSQILRNLHFELLNQVKIFPVIKVPQVVITTKNWKFKTSHLRNDMEFWKLEYKND